MTLGLAAIPASQWIEIDAHYQVDLAERRRLLAAHRDDVAASLPESEGAQQELLATLAEHLCAHAPAWFSQSDGSLKNHLTGEAHRLDTADPLGLVGRLVQEDFCLLRGEAGRLRLIGAVLCFPSRWRLADKMDRDLGAIHGPVPFYPDRLANSVDRFLTLLKPGRLAKRMSWSVIDDPALFQPSGHGRIAPTSLITPGNAGAALFLRVERQTFRRLPRTGVLVFGIRIHVTALAQVTAVPGEAARLREAILALPAEMERYKSVLPFRPALLAYLDRLAGAVRQA